MFGNEQRLGKGVDVFKTQKGDQTKVNREMTKVSQILDNYQTRNRKDETNKDDDGDDDDENVDDRQQTKDKETGELSAVTR